MTKLEQCWLCSAAIAVGMILVVGFHTTLLYFEWAMLAIGGNFR